VDHLVFEGGLGERLDDVTGSALLGCQHDVFLARLGGHHQYRDVLELLVLLDLGQQLEAVHVRHVDVADDEVEVAGAQLLQCDHTILGLVGVGEAALLEQVAHDAPHGGEVVDNQESGVGHG